MLLSLDLLLRNKHGRAAGHSPVRVAALEAEGRCSGGAEEAEASLGRRGHCLKNKHSLNHGRKEPGSRET